MQLQWGWHNKLLKVIKDLEGDKQTYGIAVWRIKEDLYGIMYTHVDDL